MKYINIVFLLWAVSLKGIICERLHEQIYSKIEGGAACFRRLNATHQAGCSSSLNGAVGVVHMVQDITDAQWIVYNSSAGPYVAVVSTLIFDKTIELLLAEPDNIAGILLFDNTTSRPDVLSHEEKCPNQYYSSNGSTCSSKEAIVWNEQGTGLLRRDIPYPIFYLPSSRIEEIDKIEDCYRRYNSDLNNQRGRPLCSLELSSFMYAAVSSTVCMRRSASSAFLTPTKVCDPLGDYNVYYSLFPRSKEAEPKTKPVNLVTARIDTSSLFDAVAPGAASSVVGMVTLIVAASTLSQMIPLAEADLYDVNVLWTLFNGEAFDYIGSQRVAYDLAQGAWPAPVPLAPHLVRLHVELGQIGGSLQMFKNSTLPLYAFAPYLDVTPPKITEFLVELTRNANQFNLDLMPEFTLNLPPSSLHSFRRILKNATQSEELLEVLLTDFKETFTNKYYESVLDDYDNIGYVYHNISFGNNGTFISTDELLANGTMKDYEPQVKIARLAAAVARTLYQQVTGKPYAGNLTSSAHLVDEMLYCFLQSQACRLLAAAEFGGRTDVAPESPASLYVGVATSATPAAVYAGHLLALLTGQHLPAQKTDCDTMDQPGFSYYWLRGWNGSGTCVQTTMNFSQAVSPAFIQPDYSLESGEYSSWTESVWQAMTVRVFVSAGGGGARVAGAAGALATLLVALLTRRLQVHAATLFSAPATTAAPVLIPSTVNC